MSPTRILRLVLAALLIAAGLYLLGLYLHLYGELESAGSPTPARVPAPRIAARERVQQRAAATLSPSPVKQILFGDLHVHTTFSTDAFLWSLPIMQGGDGAHTVSAACDYARFCSQLDFWSINDHAEASTPRKWDETRRAIRECQALAGSDENPDLAVFLGWEWTQVGRVPEEHYGHKNVILRQLDEKVVPARPISSAGLAGKGMRSSTKSAPWFMPLGDPLNPQRLYDFIAFLEEVGSVRECPHDVASPELPADCFETAATPADLFQKLAEWEQHGVESMVIPHGNTWGYYTPPGSTWDKQLVGNMHDAAQQPLIEVMSGHGNSEEYREFRATRFDASGKPFCPEPTAHYLPSCWRAGQLIEARCLAEGQDAAECTKLSAKARRLYLESGVAGHRVVPGTEFEAWLDSGQCKDCFRPSFNYRPGGSTQYALAISNFEDPDEARRFRFGFIASSDNHRARPGAGYKPVDRKLTTEANGARDAFWREMLNPMPAPSSAPALADPSDFSRGFAAWKNVSERHRTATLPLVESPAA